MTLGRDLVSSSNARTRCLQIATLSARLKKEFADLLRNTPTAHSASDKFKKRRNKDNEYQKLLNDTNVLLKGIKLSLKIWVTSLPGGEGTEHEQTTPAPLPERGRPQRVRLKQWLGNIMTVLLLFFTTAMRYNLINPMSLH